ncbi:MAG: hypothetical protein M3Y65_16995 [Pseudomonadota bacterium]|nr:hypothetical protein [Pseudomonadota bacterium]
MNSQMTTVPTMTITPRVLRKIANELIDVHAGKPSTAAEIDYASIGAIAGIREMCEATMEAVRAKDPTRVSQGGDLVLSGIPWSTARLGEQKAGTILDIGTGIVYDLMLLPGVSEDVTWAQAKAQVTASGGDLPSGAEMLMLERLLGAAAFKSDAYWTIETVRFEGDDHDSIQYFSDGCFDFTEPNDQMSVRGVRRVMVGDAADSNPGADTGAPAAHPPGPDLSDRPDLEALRAEVYKPADPTTIQAIAELYDDLHGIIDADDEGNAAEVCQSVIKVIDGLMIIVDMKKLLACSGL